ncbi:MAG: SPOR domain-containing protein [Pseudomonas sp.]|jgi:cell division septation protein DedD|nr:SPOR domain-containing protein [Pseudomonas sp.]
MRWLFLGLLIVNALYFVWSQQDFVAETVAINSVVLQKDARPQAVKLINEAANLHKQRQPAESRIDQSEIMLLGGFADEQLIQTLQQRLLSLDIQSTITSLDNQVDIEYWVYLAPLASRQASVRQLKEMQARKIEGYLITQGELTNGISLGMFAREDSAKSVAERLKEAGYEPLVRPIQRSQRLYWVIIGENSRRLVDQSLLRQLVLDFAEMKHLLLPSDKPIGQ